MKSFSLLEEGTRLRSITDTVSKCLAPMRGKLQAGSWEVAMKKPLLMSLLSLVIIVGIPIAGFSNDLSDRFGIGLGHPYLALKYGFNPKLSGEVRIAFGESITVYGIRAYYNFNPETTSVLFLGLEGNGVTFGKEDTAGTGFVLMPLWVLNILSLKVLPLISI